MTYCEKCMQPTDGGITCPSCGRLLPAPEHHLAPGTVLQGKYLVGRAIGEDGGGITYIGRDLAEDVKVTIREYFPAEEAQRDRDGIVIGLQGHETAISRFLEKARLLAEFRGEVCLAAVQGSFHENHTAYMVMEAPGGVSMQTYLWKKGTVPAQTLLELMKPMMQALQQLHRRGIIHRNINPATIRMYPDGTMKLVDFGTVQGAVDENSLKPGYAPAELYGFQGRPGPWSDVYALCASIYACITGVVPQLSVERAAQDELRRPSELSVALTERQERALMRGLAVWPQDRIRSVTELMDALDLVEEEIPVFETPVQKPEEVPEEPVEEVQVAPRWEPVDDPAAWEDMPQVDGPTLLDPVMRQGRAYAEPVVDVMEHSTDEEDMFAEEAEAPEYEQTDLFEKLDLPAEEENPVVEELPAEEVPQEEPEEIVDPDAWQGDYKPVEPIDPKFWERELGLETAEEKLPWEETPAVWQEQTIDLRIVGEQKQQPQEETPEQEEAPRKKWGLFLGIAVAVLVLAVAAVVWLFAGRGAGTKGLEISIDGVSYDIPCVTGDLYENGWADEEMTALDLVGVDRALMLQLYNGGSIRVMAENTTDEELPLGQCPVTRITLTDRSVSTSVGSITLASSLEDVTAALGDPDKQEDGKVQYYDNSGYVWSFTEAEDGNGLKSIVIALEQ